MQNFQRLLKRGDDEETSKGSTERDEGGNDDAERGQTPSETRAENVPTQGFQVSHSITLTVQVLIKQIRLQQHCLHCPYLRPCFIVCVCVVPQLSVPAAEPASGLPEDHRLPESHFRQRGGLQRQGDSTCAHELLSTHVVPCFALIRSCH